MEEKTNNDEKNADFLNESVKIALCLPTKVEHRGSTARERLLQVFRKLARRVILLDGYSLLDIAVAHSPVLCKALKLTKSKSRSTRQQEPTTTETIHHILSEHEETYTVKTYRQKQRLCLLKLRLCLTDGVLTIHAEAPLSLWLQTALEESHSSLLYHVVLSSFLDAKV